MRQEFIEKYFDNKLVRMINCGEIQDIAICDNYIRMTKKNGTVIDLEFDTYKSACDGLKLLKSKLKWEEEFEDYIFRGFCKNAEQMFLGFNEHDISDLLDKFIYEKTQSPISNKVRIKARNGAILIERVK